LLAAGLTVEHADLAAASLEPRAFAGPRTRHRVIKATFRRSAAGGFGTAVPEPTSGGGG
jgi:hypothetical protein